jgi:hypothetical protein
MWDRTMRTEHDVRETSAYILRNPMAAGLIEDGEQWPWLFSHGG